eukprot:CAMPEP_0178418538 /NCGR_PEP_ID=MMETSP0689_2-20121128/25139_1 /TAXON_ID=160604 /ORGANISM="Amphidinium massartii, Strain CS-259" /LENGTH=495 /DNA_ID=CAMNT_0020039933 /DNA_START=99 /DNA_END=1587 /DNA_ORIENTATION=-
MYEHYLFFESEGNPAEDPVIMWTNGGPGASSLFGSFTELGPYFMSEASLQTAAYNSTGVPTLFENKWRWTKLGSLIVRNLPPPVGFSYCDPVGPAGDGNSCGSWNDTKVAKHSYEFMKGFMKAFPEYSKSPLFLTGESYAGLYVPMLAREIVEHAAGDAEGAALAEQLQGFAVGDGCLGGSDVNAGVSGCTPDLGPYFQVEFFHGHGQFSEKTYAEIQSSCGKELVEGVKSKSCIAALNKMDEEKGYSFLYDECYDFSTGTKKWYEQRSWWGPPKMTSSPNLKGASTAEDWHMDGTPCGGGDVLAKWVNTSEAVKAALHVAPNAYFFSGDNGVGFTYNCTEKTLVPWYQKVTKESKLRILIYNGDTDPGLNSFYAQNWTSAVGLPEKESWRPWTRDGKIKMGGSITRYQSAGAFDFLTIRGSGHMVPEYKPEAAHIMLQSYLKNEDYPRYTPPKRPNRLSRMVSPPEMLERPERHRPSLSSVGHRSQQKEQEFAA